MRAGLTAILLGFALAATAPGQMVSLESLDRDFTETVKKVAPARSPSRRSSRLLVRSPLCATATGPPR